MNKQHTFGILMLLGILLMLFSVVAEPFNMIRTITITTPIAGATVGSGTQNFRGEYTGNSSGNVTLWTNTSANAVQVCADTTLATANTTWTCSQDLANIVFNTDCDAQTMNVTASNFTGTSQTGAGVYANYTAVGTQTGVILDNTVPTHTVFTSDYKDGTIQLYKPNGYVITATDNCDTSLTYAVRLYKPDTTTITKTTASGTWDDDLNMIGTYTLGFTATDNGDNVNGSGTTTAFANHTVDVKGGDEDLETLIVSKQKKAVVGQNFNALFLIIAAIIVIMGLAGMGYYIYNKH